MLQAKWPSICYHQHFGTEAVCLGQKRKQRLSLQSHSWESYQLKTEAQAMQENSSVSQTLGNPGDSQLLSVLTELRPSYLSLWIITINSKISEDLTSTAYVIYSAKTCVDFESLWKTLHCSNEPFPWEWFVNKVWCFCSGVVWSGEPLQGMKLQRVESKAAGERLWDGQLGVSSVLRNILEFGWRKTLQQTDDPALAPAAAFPVSAWV